MGTVVEGPKVDASFTEIDILTLSPEECIDNVYHGDGTYCGALATPNSESSWVCTREPDHDGIHVAHIDAPICAWSEKVVVIEEMLDDLRSIHQATL